MALDLRADLVSSSCPSPLHFRAHAAFGEPELYQLLKAGDIGRTAPWPPPAGSAVGNGSGLTIRHRGRILQRRRLGRGGNPGRCA